MIKSVRLNTELVEGSRDASTVEAMSAAFVDNEDGNGGALGGDAAGIEAGKAVDFGPDAVLVKVELRGATVRAGARLR